MPLHLQLAAAVGAHAQQAGDDRQGRCAEMRTGFAEALFDVCSGSIWRQNNCITAVAAEYHLFDLAIHSSRELQA